LTQVCPHMPMARLLCSLAACIRCAAVDAPQCHADVPLEGTPLQREAKLWLSLLQIGRRARPVVGSGLLGGVEPVNVDSGDVQAEPDATPADSSLDKERIAVDTFDLDVHESSTCPSVDQLPCLSSEPGKQAVAVVIAGLRERLLLNSTTQKVIKSMADDGFRVHVYLHVVGSAPAANWDVRRGQTQEDPSTRGLQQQALYSHLHDQIEEVGGCLACFHYSEALLELPSIPDDPIIRERLRQYRPKDDPIGKNALRLWKARETMWVHAKRVEEGLGVWYQAAMWIKEDAFWWERLNLKGILAMSESPRAVWSRKCQEWKGINDRVLIFNRQGADVMLRAYTSFFNKGLPLSSFNSEAYMQALAHAGQLELHRISPTFFPEVDSMVSGSDAALCIFKCRLCGKFDLKQHGLTFC